MIPRSEDPLSYQKRHLETIVVRRLELKAPITALTERFTVRKPPTPPSDKPTKKLAPTGSFAVLMRNLSSASMMQLGPSPNPVKLATASKLRYPHPKTPMNVSDLELDSYVVKDGRVVKRKPDPWDQSGAMVGEVKKYEKRKAATYLNFAEMKSLDQTNRLLRRQLSQVLKSSHKPSPSVSSEGPGGVPATPPKAKPMTAGSRPANLNILRFNKSAVCNITSEQAIPRADVGWRRSMVKSPYSVNTSNWSDADPKLLNTTISSQTLKTRFRIQERLNATTANVFVRYPYCHECTRTAMPIKVQLEKSWD